jgi:uncharacterized CHY-type Zn-finger protein
MLNVTEHKNFKMGEFYCAHCGNWFLTIEFNGVIGCPYCQKPVELNGEFEIKDVKEIGE